MVLAVSTTVFLKSVALGSAQICAPAISGQARQAMAAAGTQNDLAHFPRGILNVRPISIDASMRFPFSYPT
jgi:hypothetical protein